MNSSSTFPYALMMLFGALIVQFIPMSGDWVFWKPNFLLLMMIAWMLYFPDQYGIEFAVIIGIFADFIFVSTLGFHILIFSICGLILIFFHRIVVYLQLIHRVTLVFLMILLAEFIGAAIDSSIDKQLSIKGVLLLAIISAICWIPLDKFVAHCYSRQK
ncbi:MAG: rod shape-determining protein MreD [Porticoccaceae bacterium]